MWRFKAVVNGLLPGTRTHRCMRHMTGDSVPIRQDATTGKCRYTRLQVCGSVWRCPVCSTRITERRRKELVEAVAYGRANGYTILMVTQTFSHAVSDDLGDTLDKLRRAQRYFVSGRAAAEVRNHVGLAGTIRALEVTYGKNGWHPHLHTLWVLASQQGKDGEVIPLDRLRLKRLLFCLWYVACRKVGLRTSYKHGLDVSSEEKAVSGYVAKWGIETEMTKANYKVGQASGIKADHVTPWGMLAHIADQGPKTPLYTAKFVEYAEQFQGERQLYWSKGTRKLLGLDQEQTDEEVALEAMLERPEDIELARLTIDQWVPITRYNLEAQLLTVAEADPAGIAPFVQAAKHRYLQAKADREAAAAGVAPVVVPLPKLVPQTPQLVTRLVFGGDIDFGESEWDVPPCQTPSAHTTPGGEEHAGAGRPADPACDDVPGYSLSPPLGVASTQRGAMGERT